MKAINKFPVVYLLLDRFKGKSLNRMNGINTGSNKIGNYIHDGAAGMIDYL